MEKLDLASIDNRQRIINTFVNSIYVFEDRFEINFNCREGFEIIPLDNERFVSRLEILGEPKLRIVKAVRSFLFQNKQIEQP